MRSLAALTVMACCLFPSGLLAQEGQAQPPLIKDEIIQEGDWTPVINWLRTNVSSEDFDNLATINTAMAVWVDDDSLVRTASTTKAWLHIEFFSEGAVQAAGLRSMMALNEYRCEARQQRQLAGASYTGTNRTGEAEQFDESRPSAWRYVRPDQIDNEILDAVCNGTRIFDGTADQ